MEINVCLQRVAGIKSPSKYDVRLQTEGTGSEYADSAATGLGASQWDKYKYMVDTTHLMANLPVLDHITLGQRAFRKLLSLTKIRDDLYEPLDLTHSIDIYRSRAVFAGLDYLDTGFVDFISEVSPLHPISPKPTILNMLLDYYRDLHQNNVRDCSSYHSVLPREFNYGDDKLEVTSIEEGTTFARYDHFNSKRVLAESLIYEDMVANNIRVDSYNIGACNYYTSVFAPSFGWTKKLAYGSFVHTPDSFELSMSNLLSGIPSGCVPNIFKVEIKPARNIRVVWSDVEDDELANWEIHAVIYNPLVAMRYNPNIANFRNMSEVYKIARERDYILDYQPRGQLSLNYVMGTNGGCPSSCLLGEVEDPVSTHDVCPYIQAPDVIVQAVFSISRNGIPWFPLGIITNVYDFKLVNESIAAQFVDLVGDVQYEELLGYAKKFRFHTMSL